MEGRLINTSMSSRGWSFYSDDAHCPALPFAKGRTLTTPYGKHRPDDENTAEPLVKGTMGHVLQSHYLARIGCEQGGLFVAGEWSTTASDWLGPHDALDAYIDINPHAAAYRDQMHDTFAGYLDRHPEAPGRVRSVETEHYGVIGTKAGKWGYWAIDPLMADYLRKPVAEHPMGLLAADGAVIDCSPLNVPGHPEHGYPVWMSRRSDADIEIDRRVIIFDHKHQAFVKPSELNKNYSLIDGFCAFRHLGSQVYGRSFGGVWIQAIQVGSGYTARVALKPTPARDATFAIRLWLRAHEMFGRQVACPTGVDYRGWRGDTKNCWRYKEPCEGLEFCFGVRADEL